jgi:hypothetical protein
MIDPALRACRGDQKAALKMLTTARQRAAELIDRFWPEIGALDDALAHHGGVMAQADIEPYLRGIPRTISGR